jgi:hypothetical protein
VVSALHATGMVLFWKALLDENPRPTEHEIRDISAVISADAPDIHRL